MNNSNDYPTFDIGETVQRMRQSLDVMGWALSIVPAKYTHDLPSFYPTTDWTTATNVAHLALYDELLGNPLLEAIAAGGDGVGSIRSPAETWFQDEARELATQPVIVAWERLEAARNRGIKIVESFDDERFNARVSPVFSTGVHGTPPHSAGWVANKTVQHTWEHGNAVLRMALFAPRE